MEPETNWDAWARVPDRAKAWLYLNDGLLLPPAIWEDLQRARFATWWAREVDGYWALEPEAWEFIRANRPTGFERGGTP